MKILFLCHYFHPEVNAPASRTYENAKRWVQAGHQVTVITSAPNAPRGEVFAGYRNLPRQVEYVDGIKVVRVWTFIAANKGTWRRILNYVTYMISSVIAVQFERKPDVLVATSPQFFCGWAGVLIHWIRRWRFVLEIRDIWPESISTVGAMEKGLAFRCLEAMEKKMYQTAGHIVAVGKGYRDNLIGKGVAPEKISVIYNGVDLEKFKRRPKDQAFMQKYGLENHFLCGYIGTIGMAHGLEIVLRAAEITKDKPWKFLVVGDGARLDALRDEAERKGLKNVVFTGRLSKEEMPAAWSVLDACLIHLKKSDLFKTVIPSKMFEAMGMGIPILMGVEGESMGIVEAAGAGMAIEPEDESALISACELVAATEGNEFGERGFQYVKDHFNRDVLAREYLQVLETART